MSTVSTSRRDGARSRSTPASVAGDSPWLVGIAMQEMFNSANMAFAMAPLLTQGAYRAGATVQ